MNKPKTFDEACYQVANELAELVISKQKDYGTQNILKFGEQGILVRMSDKIERLINLQNKEGKTEPKYDAIDDLGGYSIVWKMLNKGYFELPLQEGKSYKATIGKDVRIRSGVRGE